MLCPIYESNHISHNDIQLFSEDSLIYISPKTIKSTRPLPQIDSFIITYVFS